MRRIKKSGMSAVELGLLLLVLMLILMGTIDFSRVLYAAVTVADAARAGVQYGMQTNGHSGDFTGMKQAADENSKDLKGFSCTAERFCTCQNGTTVNCVSGTCAEGVPRIYIRVTGQNNFKALVNYPGVGGPVNLREAAVFRVQ